MYNISDEVKNLTEKTKKTWKMELTTGEKSFAKAKITISIYTRDDAT